jgi:ABC-type antimicrobial peptide transport system permease subunit
VKKIILFGFVCGAVSVIVFHQGTAYLMFHQFAVIKTLFGAADSFRPASAGYNFRGVPPFGVPAVLSLAFWGGLWGILLAWLIRQLRMPDLITGFLLGAVVCTVFGFTVVAMLRGVPMWGGGNSVTWWRVLILNGAWGWGAAFLMRPFGVSDRGED